jgi:predicted  nucleic acid-binding Zn-ribbon protein
MLPDLKLVIRLQEIDIRLADLAREIAGLPKHIADIEKKLGTHERKLDADRAALAANQKERKKCEGDIQVQQQKASKLKDQMSGAKNNEVFKAFQTEIEFCDKEIRRWEDRILELMGESEPLDKNVKAAEVALKAEKAQVEAEKTLARERTAVHQRAATELQAERANVVREITPATCKQYERVRKGRKGIAVAEVLEGRCNACQMILRLQYYQDVKRSESILFCESCQRILYYNPPQSFDDLTDGHGGAGADMATKSQK